MIAYISHGKLYLVRDGKEPQEYESEFLREKIEDIERENANNAFAQRKDEDEAQNPFALWGNRARSVDGLNIIYQQVRIVDGAMIFQVRFGQSVGLFRYDPVEDYEQRLFHKNDFYLQDFDYDPKGDRFVFAIGDGGGCSHLYMADHYGRLDEQLTSGDSLDQWPRFIDGDRIMFSTAGIGRDAEDMYADRQAFHVASVACSGGEVETVCALDGRDLLSPQLQASGDVLAVSSRYRSEQDHGMWPQVKSILLFPYYLVVALFGFLQGFIRLFGKKDFTLVGPNIRQAKQKRVLLFGSVLAEMGQDKRTPTIPSYLHLSRFARSADGQAVQSEEADNLGQTAAFRVHGAQLFQSDGRRISDASGKELLRVPADHFITAFDIAPE